MSELDEPATVIWSGTAPGAELSHSNNSSFDTLREAILFVMKMSPGDREQAMIHTKKGRKISFLDIEVGENK